MPDRSRQETGHVGNADGSVFVHSVRIYHEDPDAGGVVYHASHLRFAERARAEALRALGFESATLQSDLGVAIAVRHLSCDYVALARLDELLHVHTRVRDIGGASIAMSQTIKRDETIIADVSVRLVCVNLEKGRAERLPDHIRAALAPYLAGNGTPNNERTSLP